MGVILSYIHFASSKTINSCWTLWYIRVCTCSTNPFVFQLFAILRNDHFDVWEDLYSNAGKTAPPRHVFLEAYDIINKIKEIMEADVVAGFVVPWNESVLTSSQLQSINQNVSCKLNEWVNACMHACEWVSACVRECVGGWVGGWVSACVRAWLCAWASERVIEWASEWVNIRLFDDWDFDESPFMFSSLL